MLGRSWSVKAQAFRLSRSHATAGSAPASPSPLKLGRKVSPLKYENRKSSEPAPRASENLEEVRKVGLQIAENLGISSRSLTRWYEVTPVDIIRNGGMSLHWRYRYSIPLLTEITYPDHKWDRSKFISKPEAGRSFSDPVYLRATLLHIADRVGFDGNNLENWYKISTTAMRKSGVRWTLPPKLNSRLRLLQAAFPDHTWDPQKFTRKTDYHWRSIENRRKALELVGEKLGIKKGDYDAWYKVHGIYKMLPREAVRNQNRFQFFSLLFPEHKWSPHLFVSTRVNIFTAKDEDLTKLAQDMERLLGITSHEGWYAVTRKDLARQGFETEFATQGNLLYFLQIVYPSIDWDPGRLRFAAFGFGSLFTNVVKLFGRNVQKGEFKRALLVPAFNLLFDYHGPQYYAKQLLEKRDIIEREERPSLVQWCQEKGFTLISIPFWFDRDKKSLLAELWILRPDLFAETGPLFPYKTVASSNSRQSSSIPRRTLVINPNYIKAWRTDPRFADLVPPESATLKRRTRKPKVPPTSEAFE